MQTQKVDKTKLVVLEGQDAWKKVLDTFLEFPDGFKPRAYMFTDANWNRQSKFRLVVDKKEQAILILGDSLPSHRGAKLFYEEGVVNAYFNDTTLFSFNDLLRLLTTVSRSVKP